MKTLSIFAICVLLSAQGREPQVYEDVDDQVQVESNTRVVRDPFNQRTKAHKAPMFQYHETTQQDQRRSRYAQQQRSDIRNILKSRTPESGPVRVSLAHWIDPTIAPSTIQQTQQPKKSVTSRKLNPNSYYEDDDIKRQDNNQIVYVDPQIVKRRSEYDINALNALVGQNPSNQLEGLKRLLQSPQSNFVLPPIKGPLAHPVAEQTYDIPNPNTHPNVDTSVSIENLQSQLDEAAKAQLAKALAEAQQQAQEQVEAQHRAIAQAQVEAQKKALAQIALHNQALKPVALPLKQELYAPNHRHQEQKELRNQELRLKKTKTAQQSPTTYQQVVLATQNEKQASGVNQLRRPEDGDEHQYAARYAFGYKIRDVKMGNEFGHEEKRDGENAKGLYHVLLPDGRMQKVEYYADPSGFHAKVTYEDLAH